MKYKSFRVFYTRKAAVAVISVFVSLNLVSQVLASTITENFASMSLGTTISGSSLFANTGAGVEIVNAGTGTTSTSGFSGSRHARFNGATTRELRTISLDLRNAGDLTYSLINGRGSNGGETTDANEDFTVEYSTNGGSSWVQIVFHDFGGTNSASSWTQYTYAIPVGAKTSATIIRFRQTSSSGSCCDHYGLDDVALEASTTTTLSTPSTPTASPTTGTLKSITVNWSSVSNASSYTLKLYASNGTSLLATITGLSSTSRTITTSDYASLADGTTYQVSITAIGNGTTYLDSLESTKRTVTTSQTLSNATLSSASPTSATLKSINLTWSSVLNASNYTIKIYDQADSLLETLTNVSGTSKTITTSDLASLANSTLYKFSIQAIGNNTSYLSSSESSLVSATTHAPVTLSINRSLSNPYSSRQLQYTFTFSESISGFTSSNITVSGTSTGWTLGSLTGSGSSYSITLTNSNPQDGTINLTVDNTGIAAVSSSVQPANTSATTYTLGKVAQVTSWIKFLWGEELEKF